MLWWHFGCLYRWDFVDGGGRPGDVGVALDDEDFTRRDWWIIRCTAPARARVGALQVLTANSTCKCGPAGEVETKMLTASWSPRSTRKRFGPSVSGR